MSDRIPTRNFGDHSVLRLVGISTTAVLGAGLMPAAQAATFSVLNLNDSGAGSLRQAIADANAMTDADIIIFDAGVVGTITLTSGALVISESVDVQGPGAANLTISGNNSSRVFDITGIINVTVSQLTVAGGRDLAGGGIRVRTTTNTTGIAQIVLDQLDISGNASTGDGGGVHADGFDLALTIRDSVISGNTAAIDGGGMYVEDTAGLLLIENTRITGNQAGQDGGGIYFYDPDADVQIERSTISGNTASGKGGGIYLYSFDTGGLLVSNSTISGNTAARGGGIYFYDPDTGSFVIENSTVSGNSATTGAGGIQIARGSANITTIRNSTVAANTTAAANGGGITLGGSAAIRVENSIVADNTANGIANDLSSAAPFNLFHDLIEAPGTASTNDLGGNILNTDPQLGPLADNGGPTLTHLPAVLSPVVDAGDPVFVAPPATDQRGTPRVFSGNVDMGAVENGGSSIFLDSATYSVSEDGALLTVTVNRALGVSAVSVDYATSDGSATVGADYTATSGTLNFAIGATTASFDVPILDDALVEGDESFNITLSSPSTDAALGTPMAAVATIVDVEAGSLQLSSPTYSVNEDGTMLTVSVDRVGGSAEAVSVDYVTSNGTATAGADYTATSGTLNFAIGATSASFDVPILDDALVEGDETFNITLSNPTGGAVLGMPTAAVATIVDVEAGTLQLSSPTYSVNEDGTMLTVSVDRVGGSTEAVSVDYATSDGSATAGADYTAASGTLNFAIGATSASFDVPILDDALVDGDETFNVTLSNPTGGAVLGTPTAAVATIVDVEAGTLQLSSPTFSVNEDGTMLTVSVDRSGGSTEAVSVDYATSDGSATAGADYTAASGTLNFAVGAATASFDVPILDDALVEGDETFNVTLSNPTGGAVLGTPSAAVATIVDVEAGALQLSSPTYSVNEDGTMLTVSVDRVGGSTEAVSVDYATSDGSATAGSDYTAASGTLNFAIGATTASFDVPILDDALVEGDETFSIALSNPTGGAILGTPIAAIATIVDVEAGTFGLSSAAYSVNETGTMLTVTVDRTGGSTEAVNVDYATSNGTATAGADYAASGGTLNFAIGATSSSFDVPILDDALIEGDETFNIAISNPTGGALLGSPVTATATIIDVEAGTLQLELPNYIVNEIDSVVTLTVNRSGGSTEAVSVDYATADGSATAGLDYLAAAGTLNFGIGQTTTSFDVTIFSDGVTEVPENFTVTLSNLTGGAVFGTPSVAEVTITDAAISVPVFSAWGQALLTLLLGLTGWIGIRRRQSGF